MKRITTYISGVSLADIEERLNELHYSSLLSDGHDGNEQTPRDRYETAFTVNFLKGLLHVVNNSVNKREKRKRRKAAA